MPSKTISVADDAYELLRKSKRPGESFSDVIRRLSGRRSLLDLVGIIPVESANKIAAAIEESRKERMDRRRQELGL